MLRLGRSTEQLTRLPSAFLLHYLFLLAFGQCFAFGTAFMMVGIEVRLDFIAKTKRNTNTLITIHQSACNRQPNGYEYLLLTFSSFGMDCTGPMYNGWGSTIIAIFCSLNFISSDATVVLQFHHHLSHFSFAWLSRSVHFVNLILFIIKWSSTRIASKFLWIMEKSPIGHSIGTHSFDHSSIRHQFHLTKPSTILAPPFFYLGWRHQHDRDTCVEVELQWHCWILNGRMQHLHLNSCIFRFVI